MKKWFFFFLMIAVVVGLWWGCIKIFLPYITDSNIDRLGQFGDCFGTLNALFTGLAFAGLVYTICLQQQEIRTTRQTVFEESFYKLIDLLNQIGDGSHIKDKEGNDFNGRYVFQKLANTRGESPSSIKDWVFEKRSKNKKGQSFSKEMELKCIQEASKEFYRKRSFFWRYYQTLYRLIKFVDESKGKSFSRGEETRYADIIRSQLSRYELFHLFFYGLAEEEKDFKALIEKHELLKYVNFEILEPEVTISDWYKKYYNIQWAK